MSVPGADSFGIIWNNSREVTRDGRGANPAGSEAEINPWHVPVDLSEGKGFYYTGLSGLWMEPLEKAGKGC